MSRVFLIASAAYVMPELAAEFGRLPPAFLPLGNRRLFAHQIAAMAGTGARILLSIPDDFEPDPVDLAYLERCSVELVPVPVGLSLGQSIVYVINVTAGSAGAFSVLYGDTLLRGLDLTAPDAISVADAARPGLGWGYVVEAEGRIDLTQEPADGATPVLSGFLAFADTPRLVQAVTRAGGDFLAGAAAYSRLRPMTLLRAQAWFDFGHASTYHQSRQAVTTERAFNRLTATKRAVTKTGSDAHKIEAEARWFEALPPPMRVFAPTYLGRRQEGTQLAYEIEYLHLPTLADLFVFGRLPRLGWERILDACDEFLTGCAAWPAPDAASAGLFLDKTLRRLDAYAQAADVSLDEPCRLNGHVLPSLERMARLAAAAILEKPPLGQTLIHGDFCFSNILYDFRAERVRVIDPRGLDGAGEFQTSGDLRYDIAKLHHSVVGLYDTILAGRFALEVNGPLDLEFAVVETDFIRTAQQAFLSRRFAGLTPDDASAPMISVLLFLSMLPLHADDRRRQTALLANAMRLFQMAVA